MDMESLGRELMIRGGMTLIIVAILYFAFDLEPIIWLLPVVVAALVWIKWRVMANNAEEAEDEE